MLAGLLLVAPPVQAGPFGLEQDDLLTLISVDSLFIKGDQTNYDAALKEMSGTGRAREFLVERPETSGNFVNLNTNIIDLDFSAALTGYFGNFINPPTNTLLNTIASFGTTGAAGPDVTLSLGNIIVLAGNFSTPLTVAGLIDTTQTGQTLSVSGNILITGGIQNIVDMFGPSGTGFVEVTVGAFNFSPSLNSLAADRNVFNSNFIAAFQGTVTPITSTPFVPEPGTALLMGGGLLGLMAVARRARIGRG
jgi:hypothetical protein